MINKNVLDYIIRNVTSSKQRRNILGKVKFLELLENSTPEKEDLKRLKTTFLKANDRTQNIIDNIKYIYAIFALSAKIRYMTIDEYFMRSCVERENCLRSGFNIKHFDKILHIDCKTVEHRLYCEIHHNGFACTCGIEKYVWIE